MVSIIMPAYNCEKFVALAIKSVVNQTFTDWELIVIDDFSNDKTAAIINEISSSDKRIRLIKNEINLGVSASRNKGIALSNEQWIAFLDSDDIWAPTKLDKQIELANRESADFIFTGSSFINENGDTYKGVFQVPLLVDYRKLKKHNVISCSSVLIKKSYFDNVKMQRDDIHEDYAVWLKILKKGVLAYGINEPLLIYRISKNSKSGKKIKTIKMTYNVFRFIGMNPLSSAYYTIRHILSSINKYRKIKFL